MLNLLGCKKKNNMDFVYEAYDELEIKFTNELDHLEHVTANLIFTKTLNDTNISWYTSDNEVIDKEGHVYRKSINRKIEIQAEISKGSSYLIKYFDVVVIFDPLLDQVKPIISFEYDKQSLIISKQEAYDLFDGVKAIDNLDGDISAQVEIINLSILNLDVAGSYELGYQVSDSAGNKSEILYRKVNVMVKQEVLKLYDVFTQVIPNEAPKPDVPKMFDGAWYHKVVSAKDYWSGIEGTIVLPHVNINRYEGAFNSSVPVDYTAKNLDNPSIYMGGTAYFESDVGLSMKQVQLGTGAISVGAYAFRPFWRYMTTDEYDIGGYDLINGRRYAVSSASPANQSLKNCIGNWHYSDTQYYYLPGDKIRMIIFSPVKNYIQLQIQVIEKSTDPYSIKIRSEQNWKDPEDFFSPLFKSPGYGDPTVKSVYKRVNAIDQKANEGKATIETSTNVINAIWESVYLHRKIGNDIYRVPFNESRSSVINHSRTEAFIITPINELTGGTVVTIYPNED